MSVYISLCLCISYALKVGIHLQYIYIIYVGNILYTLIYKYMRKYIHIYTYMRECMYIHRHTRGNVYIIYTLFHLKCMMLYL